MCGIVGFVGDGDLEMLDKMTSALVHRGPDGCGLYEDNNTRVYLGHRRLSIIDLSDGHQPMWDETGNFGVVFNGEIYNHLELRKQLIDKGCQFKTDHSDTEVLVQGYKAWGETLPQHLDGMFAFAIYDKMNRSIFLARDRFGKKPLYYSLQNGLFAFASELKAFFQHPSYKKETNRKSLQKYFAYGFLPAPNCQFNDTYKLPGGFCLHFDIVTSQIKKQAYWEFSVESDYDLLKRSESDLIEELQALLSQAVKKRLMSDVPLGIFLSGGIDSSAVLSFAVKHVPPEQIHAYSIGFNEASYDESSYAKCMADYVGVNHHLDKLSVETAKEVMPIVLDKLNEPLADPSILPTYLVSRFASQHVKVILGGDGGDELFAGYDPFKALKLASIYKKIVPNVMHKGIRKLVDILPISSKNMSLDFKLRRTLLGLSYSKEYWNSVWLSPLDPQSLEELFNEKIDIDELYSEVREQWNKSASNKMIDKTLEFYTKLYLQDDILTKVDRASMMNSLECRSPFLDKDVADFARRLPAELKYKNGQTKYLLKKALNGLVPNDIIYRRKKGFGIPLQDWVCEMDVNQHKEIACNVNQKFINQRFNQHCAKKSDHRLFLWSWIISNATV